MPVCAFCTFPTRVLPSQISNSGNCVHRLGCLLPKQGQVHYRVEDLGRGVTTALSETRNMTRKTKDESYFCETWKAGNKNKPAAGAQQQETYSEKHLAPLPAFLVLHLQLFHLEQMSSGHDSPTHNIYKINETQLWVQRLLTKRTLSLF